MRYLYVEFHHSQQLYATQDAWLMELVVYIEVFIKVLLSEYVEQSAVN